VAWLVSQFSSSEASNSTSNCQVPYCCPWQQQWTHYGSSLARITPVDRRLLHQSWVPPSCTILAAPTLKDASPLTGTQGPCL
jgi:hypothetical protein